MSLREQIRNRFQVVSEIGYEWLVHCPHPDHDDRTPSASINVDKKVWYCYSCGEGGHLSGILSGRLADERVENLLEDLEKKLAESEQKTYSEQWLDQFDALGVHPYWTGRGLTEEVCRKFRLGYDFATGRVTYPLRDPVGNVLGVVMRATDGSQPKYRYPKGVKISETMFGYYLVRQGVRDVVLVEGALDAIAMWDIGAHSVAQMGSSLSVKQIALLRSLGLRTLTVAYDQDMAGRKALERLITNPLLNFCPIRVMTWSPSMAKDPLELSPLARATAYQKAEVIV